MKRKWLFLFSFLVSILLSACSESSEEIKQERFKIGVMLSDAGLGDQSFSDIAFEGLEKARDELDITFDYRELEISGTYKQGLEDLMAEGQDLIIGIGFTVQDDLEAIAKAYPDQQFLLIDAESDLPNIHNVTFKDDEGSYLIGALAAMKSKSNVVGFIGGVNNPVIKRFEKGFIAGAKQVNPDVEVLSVFAGDFGDDQLGASIARDMIEQGADYIYPAAGFTGVGSILAAQEAGVHAFGVDSDQFFLAEDTIVSSMMKRVDTAVYQAIEEIAETGVLSEKDKVLGIKENGVSLAPIRVVSLTEEEKKLLEDVQQKLADGQLIIK
ncbi:BMP family ABC transporter substrate-binding protein [Solibacillus sp. A46]|uniref:BMP family ABC transporter substrate-binding protein n=1 Tax=Solibacillus faecavium TaxID=2762221 RepID=A0ABR8XXK6_9BACL|nr:BMP family ABC transporter substrate-binding protein [Solibacillus faecavium]MBD8036670.1 BMP family ABC transporter substrate-binding protein [Solibacillus faecavium]